MQTERDGTAGFKEIVQQGGCWPYKQVSEFDSWHPMWSPEQ